MAYKYDIDSIEIEFPETPMRRLTDKYHYKKLKLVEDNLLPAAKKGDVLAIQFLLKLVSEALNDGARINKEISSFLSKALLEIYKGEKADLAFGIIRNRGQKNTHLSKQRAFSIAFFIAEIESGSFEEKFELAGMEFHVSSDTAKKAWQKNGDEAKRIVRLNKENFSR